MHVQLTVRNSATARVCECVHVFVPLHPVRGSRIINKLVVAQWFVNGGQ